MDAGASGYQVLIRVINSNVKFVNGVAHGSDIIISSSLKAQIVEL